MPDSSLRLYTTGQVRRLCAAVGLAELENVAAELLQLLLGPAGESPLNESSPWPSEVSDDTTPVEFSIAFDATGECAVRVLGETVNTYPERRFLDVVADRLEVYPDRFDAVADLFLPERKKSGFSLWYSLIFRPGCPPKLKIYFNPQVSGPAAAADLVRTGLARLGIGRAYDAVVEHALARGEPDRFSFFAVDLDNTAQSRVKLYVSHDDAETADVVQAAGLVPGVDPAQIEEFCAILGGGHGPFTNRPLISSYSFVGGDTARPSSYGLYVPIRDYVPDDEVARARIKAVMAPYDIDSTIMDRAIAAVSDRALRNGVGLIPHVSLRLGVFGSGITVYLSSEAYGVAPPRRRSVLGLVSSR